MGTTLDIKIKRANKVYHAGEMLSGVVVISSKDSVQHQGVSLTMEGTVNLQLSAKSVGVFEAFYNSVKYTLRCDMRRSLLAKDLTKTCEFIVHSAPQKGKLTPSPVDFTITPETLQNVKEGVQKAMHAMPQRFKIFKLLMGIFVGTFLFPYIWSSPDCSPVQPWRPPTSKWSLRLMWWSFFMLTTSSLRTSH
ncbi:vacuolar protein sorting-associated protein 26C isoform X4 [Rattus norvegicus]|uniref:vacuolar protein sorting-associated protein 26C isoform X4 n=1 Tax=Rattus norvegicus TaxID=10116 RepID=UPI002FD81784